MFFLLLRKVLFVHYGIELNWLVCIRALFSSTVFPCEGVKRASQDFEAFCNFRSYGAFVNKTH